MQEAERFCDRCIDGDSDAILAEIAMGDEQYYLCLECKETIVALWLIEHEELIARHRRVRRRRREQTERRSSGHGQ